MIMDHKFGSNCDQHIVGRASWRPWRAGSALAPAFVLAGLVVAATTLIAARAAIVSILPTTGAIYAGMGMPVNLHGLSIADIRATITQQAEGQGELLVTGEIENLRAVETPVPSLRLALRGEDGRELYVWAARGPKIALGLRRASPVPRPFGGASSRGSRRPGKIRRAGG